MNKMKGFGRRHGAWYALCTALLVWGMAAAGCSPDMPIGGIKLESPGASTVDGGGVWIGGGGTAPLPPLMLPVASINGTSCGISGYEHLGNYSFSLEWTLPSVEPLDAPANLAALQDVMDTWEEYRILIDPLPGYKKDGQGKVIAGVFTGTMLNNTQAAIAAKGRIIIPRYWPKPAAGDLWTQPSTRTQWRGLEDVRIKAFKADADRITAMMAAIAASPFYTEAALQALYAEMDTVIFYNPPEASCSQRLVIDQSFNGQGVLDPGVTGVLYEYYLGHAPGPSEYLMPSPLAFPE